MAHVFYFLDIANKVCCATIVAAVKRNPSNGDL